MRFLDAEGIVDLVLHYLNSTMRLKKLQQLFAVTPTVCSRYLRKVDGVKLPVQSHADELMENAFRNGWVCDHFTTNIVTFAPDSTMIHAVLNLPDSWHEAAAAQDLYSRRTVYQKCIRWHNLRTRTVGVNQIRNGDDIH
ncbi:hypothetical protein RI367_002907 [Sorochytrium milnesiophthora]